MATLSWLSTVAVALLLMVEAASAQQSCVANLVGCQAYISTTTKPPETCCGPLKQAVDTQLSCLCSLYDSPAILKEFNISVSDALALPGRCGITGTNGCSGASPANSPPVTPGGGNSSAHGFTWIGMSGLTTLFVFLWSTLA